MDKSYLIKSNPIIKFVDSTQDSLIYINYIQNVMARVEIKCNENGPELVVVDGKVFAAMCRCGGSNSKPYCDGTHGKIGFKAEAKDIVVSEQ
jgi:CDGSH-type Zn-finger protein